MYDSAISNVHMSLKCPVDFDPSVWDCLPRDIQSEIVTDCTTVARSCHHNEDDHASTNKSGRYSKRKNGDEFVTQSTITNWTTQRVTSISTVREFVETSPPNPGHNNSAQYISHELHKEVGILKQQLLLVPIAEIKSPFTDDTFTDSAFPASAESIDGRPLKSNSLNKHSSVDTGTSDKQNGTAKDQDSNQLICKCSLPIKIRQVSKDGANQGRFFASCLLRSCNHFAWADDFAHSESTSKIVWKRFNRSDRWTLFGAKGIYGISPNDVLQGGVGDCWFLSALAVIAERTDLIQKIVKSAELDDSGKINFCLFIDGTWQDIVVDNYLPCQQRSIKKEKKRKMINDVLCIDQEGSTLAYSKVSHTQLWVPLLEKAYAKAHGMIYFKSLMLIYTPSIFSLDALIFVFMSLDSLRSLGSYCSRFNSSHSTAQQQCGHVLNSLSNSNPLEISCSLSLNLSLSYSLSLTLSLLLSLSLSLSLIVPLSLSHLYTSPFPLCRQLSCNIWWPYPRSILGSDRGSISGHRFLRSIVQLGRNVVRIYLKKSYNLILLSFKELSDQITPQIDMLDYIYCTRN